MGRGIQIEFEGKLPAEQNVKVVLTTNASPSTYTAPPLPPPPPLPTEQLTNVESSNVNSPLTLIAPLVQLTSLLTSITIDTRSIDRAISEVRISNSNIGRCRGGESSDTVFHLQAEMSGKVEKNIRKN